MLPGARRLCNIFRSGALLMIFVAKLSLRSMTPKDNPAEIKNRAEANGVDDLAFLSARDVSDLEPEVQAVAGLLSPSTGIVDVHELMLGFLADAETHSATLALQVRWRVLLSEDDLFIVSVNGAEPATITCRYLVNAARASPRRQVAGCRCAGLSRSISRSRYWPRAVISAWRGSNLLIRLILSRS